MIYSPYLVTWMKTRINFQRSSSITFKSDMGIAISGFMLFVRGIRKMLVTRPMLFRKSSTGCIRIESREQWQIDRCKMKNIPSPIQQVNGAASNHNKDGFKPPPNDE